MNYTTMNSSFSRLKLPEPFLRGKIRSLYSVDQKSLIMLTSDRISAFDIVFSETVPDKGKILNQISCLWFQKAIQEGLNREYDWETHLITGDLKKFPKPYCFYPELEGRSAHIWKVERIGFECIVRGYLAGSSWKEYQSKGNVCGQELPSGLLLGEKLPRPIFTPTSKSEIHGQHDENVDISLMKKELGDELYSKIEAASLSLYHFASEKVGKEGILLADTKFEFGINNKKLYLIDEILTPDSSRYWKRSDYLPGQIPLGLDKQYVRDYCESISWDKKPPAPPLPSSILSKISSVYHTIHEKIQAALS